MAGCQFLPFSLRPKAECTPDVETPASPSAKHSILSISTGNEKCKTQIVKLDYFTNSHAYKLYHENSASIKTKFGNRLTTKPNDKMHFI